MAIVTISGPSGTGKTSIYNVLIKEYPGLFRRFTAVTTKPMRARDAGDLELYEHVSSEEYARRRSLGEFAWDVNVHGARYGTLSSELTAALTDNVFYLANISPESTMKLRAIVSASAVSQDLLHFYLIQPEIDEHWKQRLMQRGESPEGANKRIKDSKELQAYLELKESPFIYIPDHTEGIEAKLIIIRQSLRARWPMTF